ncbi:Subtilase-type proteinase psp3 [Zancudomyces culisetae]|uniref:Subtilase-type proteinase psp3 n=1 Tax=Zancudomyces culisetae TaxID=1213189 RepID=A0A1R1PMZ8_ZANCU|nr:Subtilase-type proteinase psp3 [Zancudomyces culisetae]OMH82346.1 Subtilase-type proteinase psp3 [Zancudomyces culisetae]|eukprot:OMH82280.1 Subtilase-type proteinase psp3 [Zancudomyces culisetae]
MSILALGSSSSKITGHDVVTPVAQDAAKGVFVKRLSKSIYRILYPKRLSSVLTLGTTDKEYDRKRDYKNYIVLLRTPGSSPDIRNSYESHSNKQNSVLYKHLSAYFSPVLRGIADPALRSKKFRSLYKNFKNEYGIKDLGYTGFYGYSAKFDKKTLFKVSQMPDVELIEEDVKIKADAVQTRVQNWGLRRISQNSKNYIDQYAYSGNQGQGVVAYIMDSGVKIDHHELAGRAENGANFVTNEDFSDNKGHGTHVAGIVAGTVHGVAKKAHIVSVKVLDKNMMGMVSYAIKGIDFILKDWSAKKGKYKAAVVNMSLGTPSRNEAYLKAIDAMVAAGVHVVTSSGNSGLDACNQTPALTLTGITVGAFDELGSVPTWSNWGKCVDILAPGTRIISSSNAGGDQTIVKSGTSMAAPFVTGVVAAMLSDNPNMKPSELKQRLISTGLKGYLKENTLRGGTPNIMLYRPA